MGNLLCQLDDSAPISYPYLCPIKLGGVSSSCVVDSGNTVHNVISEDYAKKIFKTKDLSPYLKTATTRRIATAKQGDHVQVLGQVRHALRLRLGGTPVTYKTWPLVIQGLNADFNLSGPFMKRHQIDQLHSTGQLAFAGHTVSLRDRAGQTLQALQHPEAKATIPTEWPAYLDNKVHCTPHSVTYLRLRVPAVENQEQAPGTALVEGSLQFMDATDLHPVRAALTRVDANGTMIASVMNTTNRRIKLAEGTRFGSVRMQSEADLAQCHRPQPAPAQQPHEHQEALAWVREHVRLHESPWLKDDPDALRSAEAHMAANIDVFSVTGEFGQTNLVEHHIPTEEHAPIRIKNRPLNPTLENSLNKQLDKWLEEGVIEPSHSAWAFPLLAVPKKQLDEDGRPKMRWCVDYRKLNSITKVDAHGLPHIDDNLSRLSNSKVFSGLDSCGAYHVCSIRPDDREKTAFRTPRGLFQFRYMAFGLAGAPATYARLIQKVLAGVPLDIALPYLDDLAVHTKDVDSHQAALERVFQAYRAAGLKLQPSKCSWYQKEIEYLGHMVSAKGMRPVDGYVDVVKDWPLPRTRKDIRIFLGKIGYYRRYIQDYSSLATALTDMLVKPEEMKSGKVTTQEEVLLKKRRDRLWEAELLVMPEVAVQAFNCLRQKLCEAPILAFPDFSSPEMFIVDSDWSQECGAIGGVLSQVQDGEERVILFGGRKLSPAERKYGSNKGEMCAVIHFLRAWRYYLQFRRFRLRTDHQALKWIRTMEEPQGMILRWLDILANYQFEPEFRAGRKHGNADALSRAPHLREPTPRELAATEEEGLLQISPDAVPEDSSPAEEDVEEVVEAQAPEDQDADTTQLWAQQWANQVAPQLLQAQSNDPILKQVRRWVRKGIRPERSEIREEDRALHEYWALFEVLYLAEDGVLYRRAHEGEVWTRDRACLPAALQQQAVQLAHEGVGGHMGQKTTASRLLQRVYFPFAYKAVEDYVVHCRPCQIRFRRGPAQKHTLVSVQDGNPFQRLAIDFVGPYKASKAGNCYLLTVKDTFTRWLEAFPTRNLKAPTVAHLLEKHIVSRYGCPESLHSDQGTSFTAELIDEVAELLQIKKTETPAYNPKSNPVERSHKDLGAILRAACWQTGQDWETVLPSALLAIRTARSRSTGVTPFFAMYGREARLPLDVLYPNPEHHEATAGQHAHQLRRRLQACYRHMRLKMRATVERSRVAYSGKLEKEPLEEGHLVWLFTPVINPVLGGKLTTYWSGPWRVQQRLSPVLFRIATHGTWNARPLEVVVSLDRLKRYHERPEEEDSTVEATGAAPSDLRAEDLLMEDEAVETQLPNLEATPGAEREPMDLLNEENPITVGAGPPPGPVTRARARAARPSPRESPEPPGELPKDKDDPTLPTGGPKFTSTPRQAKGDASITRQATPQDTSAESSTSTKLSDTAENVSPVSASAEEYWWDAADSPFSPAIKAEGPRSTTVEIHSHSPTSSPTDRSELPRPTEQSSDFHGFDAAASTPHREHFDSALVEPVSPPSSPFFKVLEAPPTVPSRPEPKPSKPVRLPTRIQPPRRVKFKAQTKKN